MADRIAPPSKPVGRKDGINHMQNDGVINTPRPSFGRYFGDDKAGDKVSAKSSMFGKAV